MTALCCLLLLSCSSAQAPVEEPADEPAVEEARAEEPADDGMQIDGLRGSLRRDEVDPVLNRAAQRFADCYAEALEDHPYLVGDLALEFTVAPDGSVRRVWVTSATLGSREVEACILGLARGLTFPRPRGGEADFDYGPMVMNPGDETRPPEVWPVERIAERLEEQREVLVQCTGGRSGYHATFYVGPGGRVRSVGVVAPAADAEEGARCLEREIASWQDLPDPGDWVAKISLEL